MCVKGNPLTSRSIQVLKVSCLPVNVGADTYPLHETRFSMCGGHHNAAGGGKLQELGARILGLEAGIVRGDVVNLLVRFGFMNIGKALLSMQDLSRCGWETVFPADSGNAHQHRAGGKETTIPAISFDYGYSNERDDLMQEAAGPRFW